MESDDVAAAEQQCRRLKVRQVARKSAPTFAVHERVAKAPGGYIHLTFVSVIPSAVVRTD